MGASYWEVKHSSDTYGHQSYRPTLLDEYHGDLTDHCP